MPEAQPASPSKPAQPAGATNPARDALQRRNRIFAFLWAGVAGMMLIMTFGVALTVHYVEVQHVFPGF